jgi:1-acyl-sn-glycerol-3-phosphate acyltransferase
MLYWFLKLFVLGPVLRTLFRPKVLGKRNFPRSGAAILASNHVSFSDSIFLPLVAPRRITFLAKSEYFTGKGLKGILSKAFFAGVGQVPIDRSGGRASEAAITTGMRILGAGDLLGIYPEGTRSPDGRLYRGRTGVARMALEAGVPIIPVAMIGTFEIQPTGQVWPKIKRVTIAYGEPIDVSAYADQAKDPVVLRAITNQVMEALQQLSGQEYVDIYANKAREMLTEQSATQDADPGLAERIADAEDDTDGVSENQN